MERRASDVPAHEKRSEANVKNCGTPVALSVGHLAGKLARFDKVGGGPWIGVGWVRLRTYTDQRDHGPDNEGAEVGTGPVPLMGGHLFASIVSGPLTV